MGILRHLRSTADAYPSPHGATWPFGMCRVAAISPPSATSISRHVSSNPPSPCGDAGGNMCTNRREGGIAVTSTRTPPAPSARAISAVRSCPPPVVPAESIAVSNPFSTVAPSTSIAASSSSSSAPKHEAYSSVMTSCCRNSCIAACTCSAFATGTFTTATPKTSELSSTMSNTRPRTTTQRLRSRALETPSLLTSIANPAVPGTAGSSASVCQLLGPLSNVPMPDSLRATSHTRLLLLAPLCWLAAISSACRDDAVDSDTITGLDSRRFITTR